MSRVKNGKRKRVEDDGKVRRGFFKKIWFSIDKVDKYGELAAEGAWRAFKYLILLLLILTVLISGSFIFKFSKVVGKVSKSIEEKVPEFTYKNEQLMLNDENSIYDEELQFVRVIMDTREQNEELVNSYIEKVNDNESFVVILRDGFILKINGAKSQEYKYSEIFSELNVIEFNKSDVINYLSGKDIMPVYVLLFALVYVYVLGIYFINYLINVIVISIVGFVASRLLKLKIKYVAIFNMAIYSITLSILLEMIYIIINTLFGFIVNYFEIMYVLVASIYMLAAIFILKIDANKKREEVKKVIEVQKQIDEESDEISEEDVNEDVDVETEVNLDTEEKENNYEKDQNQDGLEGEV